MRARLVAATASLLGAAVHTVDAQRIRGVVRDSADGRPVPAAVVSLLDSAGRAQLRTLTGADGRFLIQPLAATARIQVRRIGFRPREVPIPNQARVGEATVDFTLSRVPAILDAVEATDKVQCPPRPDRLAALALWAQAQSAFLAAVVARQANPAQIRIFTYDRTVQLGSGRVVSQAVRVATNRSTRSFAAARSPAQFVERGYLDEDLTGRTFYAPDADVLMDESFRNSHCFFIGSDAARRPGQLALHFEPALGRDTIADVAGVVWLDRSPLAVREVEFRYTGVEPAIVSAGGGGLLSFRTLANGIPFIDDWVIRMVSVSVVSGRGISWLQLARAHRTSAVATGMSHSGGAVRSIEWADGTSWRATFPELTGVVVERQTSRPLAGIRLSFSTAPFTTSSGTDGGFVFPDMLAGPYQLVAKDTTLERFGVERVARQSVNVSPSARDVVRVELPSDREMIANLCRGQRPGLGPSALIARVIRSDGSPVGLAPVTVVWRALGPDSLRVRRDSVVHRASEAGTLPICWLGAGHVRVSAAGDSSTSVVEMTIPERPTLATATIVIGPRR